MKSWIWRGLAALACTAAVGAAQAAEPCASQPGGAVEAARRANAFVQTLSADQKQTVLRPRDRASIIKWSNLPLALAPRIGLRLGDLRPDQAAAAQQLLRAVLSSCGVDLLAEIRAADGVLMPLDTRKIGWNPGNYFMAFIGAPSPSQPWSLQVGGHHMAYNLAFNAPQVSATPLFDGVEPTQFVADGRAHEPLAVQMGAMRAVASSIADLPGARLAGEFRDVTRGATENGDTNFPMTYPAGDSGRGVAYAKLAAAQKALVREAMRAWIELPNAAISRPLMAEYVREAALAQTYVGFAGAPDLTTPGSYVRIDGPRMWIEFVVQPAVADKTKVHYHTIWRDKLADYGGAFRR